MSVAQPSKTPVKKPPVKKPVHHHSVRTSDAAYPFPTDPPGVGFCFYLNSGEQTHAWSKADVETWSKKKLYRIPLWVRENPGNGDVDAKNAISQLKNLGLPLDRAIAIDLETAVIPSYVHDFTVHYEAEAKGVVVVYGSLGNIFKNGGKYNWPADPGHQEMLYANSVGTQYYWGPEYDLSEWDGDFAFEWMQIKPK